MHHGYSVLVSLMKLMKLPKCLLSHFKTIYINGFKGSQFFGYRDEKEVMTKCLLKNSQVLQMMTIHAPGLFKGEEKKSDTELLMLQWGSNTRQVEVNTNLICLRDCVSLRY